MENQQVPPVQQQQQQQATTEKQQQSQPAAQPTSQWQFDNFNDLKFGQKTTETLLTTFKSLPEDQQKQISTSVENYGRFVREHIDHIADSAKTYQEKRSKKDAETVARQTKFIDEFKESASELWGEESEKHLEVLRKEASKPSPMLRTVMDLAGKLGESRGVKRNIQLTTTGTEQRVAHAASAGGHPAKQTAANMWPTPVIPESNEGTKMLNGIYGLL